MMSKDEQLKQYLSTGCYLSNLVTLYETSEPTFKRWIEPIYADVFPPNKNGNRNKKMNPAQVKKIVDHIDFP